ncbi:RNA polymerase sigma factor SigJ [Paenibacillus sp. LHD-38]|uniref:RNA polymerase sigma factor SigJ n=1 Tax=Paenibacillus sp. LHD-38 TaxID=3072143 RepID=UPI00280CD01F|nr:RNA polymerase sigma factor SigJ [Paenibacillus sp. LHD-38]MDQ8734112.1 RNA polymerase sigma factor SigJ [Paenibacillus sp. LHD-38]
MDFEKTYAAYRPLLHSIAYRMLGTFSEAEDLVQDVFADYSLLDASDIHNEKAYLVRMVTNRSINLSQSARKRREVYVGQWLPEPNVGRMVTDHAVMDPAELYVQHESISYALLVMLEQLSAVERAVFVLRESLAYDYDEIAACLQKTETNCRKIYSRSKEKLQKERELLPINTVKAEPLVVTFMEAAATGDYDKLVALLTEEAVLVSDGGGKVRAAIFAIISRARVMAFLQGVIPRTFLGDGHRFTVVNGQAGVVIMKDGKPRSVISFQLDPENQHFERIFVMLNPDKLKHVLAE